MIFIHDFYDFVVAVAVAVTVAVAVLLFLFLRCILFCCFIVFLA